MARGSGTAQAAANNAQGFSKQLQGNAQNTYSALFPELTSQAMNPQGMSPSDLSAARTEAMEGAGGTQAGAVGQGALLASRTKNPGAASAAIAESARDAGNQLSRANLGLRGQNVRLKEQQRQQALTGLEGLEGQQIGGANNALGIVPEAVNADTRAAQSDPWNQFFSGLAGAGGTLGTGLAGNLIGRIPGGGGK